VLGKANRMVLGGAARVATSFARVRHLENDARARLTGNPVREAVRALRASPYRAPSSGRTIDLLIGGSQGAASFSQVVPETLAALPGRGNAPACACQQCRPEDLERGRGALTPRRASSRAGAVLADLPRRLAGPSGDRPRCASTVSELATIGRPSILIPYPMRPTIIRPPMPAPSRRRVAASSSRMPNSPCRRSRVHWRRCSPAPQRLADMAAAAHAAGRPTRRAPGGSGTGS